MKKEEKQLIDRYLENSLTGSELKEFLDRLDNDNEFRNLVSFHNLLIEGLQEAEDRRLAALLEKNIGFTRPLIPTALKLILTFLVVTIGGIVLWNYTGTDSSGNRRNLTSIFFRGQKDQKIPELVTAKTVQSNKSGSKGYLNKLNTEGKASNNKIADSVIPEKAVSEDIVVKKDQLLVSYTLRATEIESKNQNEIEKSSETPIAKSTAEKLNPESGLPEAKDDKGENYNVEFWVSPINYKGYKLYSDRLILFGIEEPDAVQLFSGDHKLWMKYGKEFYSLERSDDFESFVATNEIPSSLK